MRADATCAAEAYNLEIASSAPPMDMLNLAALEKGPHPRLQSASVDGGLGQ